MAPSTPPRRTAASRTPTSRPRRIAGAGVGSQPTTDEELIETSVEQPAVEDAPVDEVPVEAVPVEEAPAEAVPLGRRSRAVLVLLVVIILLLAAGTAELVAILGHEAPEDAATGPVTAEQPVQVDELTVRSVVDQAAQAAVAIGSASWEDYEAGIDAAAAMMTDPFAEKYRQTKADVKQQVVDQQVDVTVQVDAQGVVRADPTEIVALVFLTQSTIGGTGPVTPRQYRATVTMVKTADGWLVADLDAGDLLDITGGDG
ncbi:hypothetical protein BH09ACT12_BH09ACT12_15380 [soil metagenome]